MKKILVINSSLNGENSATLKMTNAFIEGLQDKIECIVEYIHLKNYEINLCTGCLICWTETPGKCCIKDDMEIIIEKYKSADYVIFNSCVHCYATPALERIFSERLLPIIEVKPIEGGDNEDDYIFKAHRPANNKHILIHSCASLNVKDMMKPTNELYSHMFNNECVMLSGSRKLILETEENKNKFLKAIIFAGQDYGTYGYVTKEVTQYIESFYSENTDLLMMNSHFVHNPRYSNGIPTAHDDFKAFSMMHEICQNYNPLVEQSLKGVIEINITDINEVYQITIQNGQCQLSVGRQAEPNSVMSLTYEVLINLYHHRIDFVTAFYKKQYTNKGDFSFIRAMSNGALIGSLNKQKELSYYISDHLDGSWTTRKINHSIVSLLPWILAWGLFVINLNLSVLVATLSALCIVTFKNKKDLTYFDKATLIGFMVLCVLLFVYPSDRTLAQYVALTHLLYATILFVSLIKKVPITLFLLTRSYSRSFNNLKTYIKVNRTITLMWGCLYLFLSLLSAAHLIQPYSSTEPVYKLSILLVLVTLVLTIYMALYSNEFYLRYKNRK